MFYEIDKNDYGLLYNLFKVIVVLWFIGWIFIFDEVGWVNFVFYSFFNFVCDWLLIVMFFLFNYKDSVVNIDVMGEFVCNMVSYDFKDVMNKLFVFVDYGVLEFDFVGLDMVFFWLVSLFCVVKVLMVLECKYFQMFCLKVLDGFDMDSWVVFGQVVGVYIVDEVIVDGFVDVICYKLFLRLGYMDYVVVIEVFQLKCFKV